MASYAIDIENRQESKSNRSERSAQTVARFEIKFYQILNAVGERVAPLPIFARDVERVRQFYKAIYETRAFDKKAVSLQRRGQLGTYASSLGQEAIGVATGSAMLEHDVLLVAYREYGAQFLRGVTMTEILLYWGGNEQGMNFRRAHKDFPICVPIASQAPHAVGVAYAMKLRGEKRVAVCVLGDGATSKGDFYEAINAAGTWQLPVVFIINNNGWAISQPRHQQCYAETLAQKAFAAGFDGEQVDGDDVIALHERIALAIEKARTGGGPTLIEALTYRLCDHTTADDASRYRSKEELNQHQQNEPLRRLRIYLAGQGEWSQHDETQLQKECRQKVEEAVDKYLNTPPQPAESMFDYLYHSLPEGLQEQRREVVKWSRQQ